MKHCTLAEIINCTIAYIKHAVICQTIYVKFYDFCVEPIFNVAVQCHYVAIHYNGPHKCLDALRPSVSPPSTVSDFLKLGKP